MSRDFSSPIYKRWRSRVYARDGHACRLCGSKDGLNAHHIKMWASYPSLRFVVSNGITLCRVHHLLIRGREEAYEATFERLVKPSSTVRLQMILMRHDTPKDEDAG